MNKNTLKEDVYIYTDQLCNFPHLVDTCKHSHNETRSVRDFISDCDVLLASFCHFVQPADLRVVLFASKAWNTSER